MTPLDDDALAPARGLIYGLCLGLSLWALIAWGVYALVGSA